jgi:hypothetical protein
LRAHIMLAACFKQAIWLPKILARYTTTSSQNINTYRSCSVTTARAGYTPASQVQVVTPDKFVALVVAYYCCLDCWPNCHAFTPFTSVKLQPRIDLWGKTSIYVHIIIAIYYIANFNWESTKHWARAARSSITTIVDFWSYFRSATMNVSTS